MLLKFKKLFSLLLLVTNILVIAQAASLTDVQMMSEEINTDPWLSYQKLLTLEHEQKSKSETHYLWWLLRKAQAENLLYFHQDFEQTVQSAQALCTINSPTEIVSMFNAYAGIIAQRNGQYAQSIDLLNQAQTQAKAANLNHVYVFAKQELAYTRSLTELYETSLHDLQAAYVEAFALNDQFLIAVINETFGAIYGYLGEYDRSIEYYEKALRTYEQRGYRAHIAEAIYGMASTYRYWQKFDLAIAKFELYREKIAYSPNSDISFFGAYGLGMTLAEQGKCDKALPIIEQALALNGQIDYNAELYKRKASCLITLGQLDEAEQMIAKVNEVFAGLPELTGTTWQLEIEKISAMLAHARGNDTLGFELLQDFHQQYTDLMAKNSSERLIKVRTTLELERQHTEIALLQQRAELQSLQVAQAQHKITMQRYLLGFVVVFVLAILGFVVIQQRSTQKILALSIRDPLSNLFNRRYMFEYLEKLLRLTPRQKGELAVILIDIDDFKLVNDNFGHPFGDSVIKKIAEIGQKTLRVEDVMGRIGGEEFMGILPRQDKEHSEKIAQRILRNVENHQFITEDGQSYSVTVSIGIANMNPDAIDANTLYAQADKALYRAKQQGKNQVSIFQN